MKRDVQAIVVLAGVFAGLLVAANAAGSKLIQVGPFAASATVFAYAFTFLITDVISEVFGKRAATTTVWTGFGAVVLGVLFFQVAILAPPASFYSSQEAFESVFTTTGRILIGGLSAYIISQLLDVHIFPQNSRKDGWQVSMASQ